MREIIKHVLAKWLVELHQRDDKLAVFGSADSDISGEEEEDRLFWVDRHLMGVALFLADVADESNDMELLGIATRTKTIAKKKIAEDSRRLQENEQQQQEHDNTWQRIDLVVENVCRPVFASIGRAGVDMSKHRKAIEDSRPYFNNPSDYLSLLIYADEGKVFNKVCKEVRRTVKDYARNNDFKTPGREWIQSKFGSLLDDVYRKADKYVAQQIKRHAPQNLIPPIGLDT